MRAKLVFVWALAGVILFVAGDLTPVMALEPGPDSPLYLPVQVCSVGNNPPDAASIIAGLANASHTGALSEAGVFMRPAIGNGWGMLHFPHFEVSAFSAVHMQVAASRGRQVDQKWTSIRSACARAWAARGRAGSGAMLLISGESTDAISGSAGAIAEGFGGCAREVGSAECAVPLAATAILENDSGLESGVLIGAVLAEALGGTATAIRRSALTAIDLEHGAGIDTFFTGVMGMQEPRAAQDSSDALPKARSIIGAIGASLRPAADVAHFDLSLSDPMRVGDRVLFLLETGDGEAFTSDALIGLGVPPTLSALSVNALLSLDLQPGSPEAKVFRYQNDAVQEFTDNVMAIATETLLAPAFATPAAGPASNSSKLIILDGTLGLRFPAHLGPIAVERPIRVEAGVIRDGSIVDRMAEGVTGVRPVFTFEGPSFAHCGSLQPGVAGQGVPLTVDGLIPSRPVYGLLDGARVWSGKTDRRGDIDFVLPVPEDIAVGLHQVSIVVDQSGLAASCAVPVTGQDTSWLQRDLTPQMILPLVRGQQAMIERYGEIVSLLTERGIVTSAEITQLHDMILRNQILLERLTRGGD